MKINSVVFINWSGNFKDGVDHNNYYCLPETYYVYMPARICAFSTCYAEPQNGQAGNIQLASIVYTINDTPTSYGRWLVPTMHFDEVYDQTHFLTSLMMTPRKYWPSREGFEYIEDIRKNFDYYNRHSGKLGASF